MRELVRIVVPRGLVLDPFAGAGTTGLAALAEAGGSSGSNCTLTTRSSRGAGWLPRRCSAIAAEYLIPGEPAAVLSWVRVHALHSR